MSTTVLGLRVLLAAVFALAAVGKLRDLPGSRRAMREFGVPERGVAAIGVLLPLAELATAAALLPSSSARWGGLAALALLLAFSAGIARALRRGEAPDCHCFGQIHSAPAGRGTLARNGALAVLAAVVVVAGPGAALDGWIGARTAAELVAVGMGVCALVLALVSLYLWREKSRLIRELGTAQRMVAAAPPGIPVGSPAPPLSLRGLAGDIVTLEDLLERGQPVLLVFVSPWCDSCVELLPKLGRWQQTLAQQLTIALVSTGSVADNRPYAEEHGLSDVLLQESTEAIEVFRIRGTPSAVIVTSSGNVGSNPAESVLGIEPMVRLALRDGTDAVANPVA
jgi:thiol-disulfide isomerase/thioredoxin